MCRKASFIFLTLFFLSTNNKVDAAGEFKNSYEITYMVEESAKVTVSQTITIENLTSNYYVPQYKFTIGSEAPTNFTARDPTGSITPKVVKKDGSTSVTLDFKAQVIGKGNKLVFSVDYEYPGLANKNGLIWEVTLPKITNLSEIASYNLTFSVPTSFGPPLFQFPSPTSQQVSGSRRLIRFDKNALLKGGPRMGFGKFQLYELSLTYHLENPHLKLGYTEIALPPDIAGYQQVIQKSLLPAPASIRVDANGNYLARYNLKPWERRDVVWEGWIALHYPERNFSDDKLDSLPAELVSRFTGAQKYWETESAEIQAEVAKLANPELPVAAILREIYNFVTEKLSYNRQKLGSGELVRLGALTILSQTDQAVCMEYTDLFITLARAAGIPAREVNGYTYTANDTSRPLSLRVGGDVLHAWPQVYLPKSGWIMVDPTWGSTSESDYFSAFDLSHLAFIVRGDSSSYPFPAGSYKTDPNQKDVLVELSTAEEVVAEKPQLGVEVKLSPFILSPFTTTAQVTVRNSGKTTAFETTAELASDLLEIEDPKLEIGPLPPGASAYYKVQLTSPRWSTRGQERLTVGVSAEDFNGKNLTTVNGEDTELVRPLYLPLRLPEMGIGIGFGLLIFFIQKLFLARMG